MEEQKIILISNDQQEFEISKTILELSGTLNSSFDEDSEEESVTIPLPNVDATTLSSVLKFCELMLVQKLAPTLLVSLFFFVEKFSIEILPLF